MRVGVKFCGHCQPRRNMTELLNLLKDAAPDISFVTWAEPDYDALLVLQACDSACADQPVFDGPRVEVIVSEIDFVEYETDNALVDAVLAALAAPASRNKADVSA